MALIWAESFDIYGTNLGFVSQAGYSSNSIDTLTVTPANIRTGTGAALISGFGATIQRAITTPVAVLGQGIGVMPTVLGGGTVNDGGLRWYSAGPTLELTVNVMPDLSVAVFDRTNTLKGSSAPNIFALNTYRWLEVKATGNTAGVNTGTVEVRVNGVVVLIVNGINLPNIFAYHAFAKLGGGGGTTQTYIDDWIVWDNSSAQNNDFMGDRRLYVSYPNANAALQDFTAVPAGNAWDRINDSPPVDTNYIEGTAAGNISEFTKGAIGIASNDVAAIVIWGRLFKSDAGIATAKIGINSVGNVLNSPDISPGITGAYYQQFVPLDPNGNIPWTRAAVDAANVRITRSS